MKVNITFNTIETNSSTRWYRCHQDHMEREKYSICQNPVVGMALWEGTTSFHLFTVSAACIMSDC